MLLWFAGTAVLAIWFVFRDPRFDYRLLVVGAIVPSVVALVASRATALDSIALHVALLAVVMFAVRRGPVRRTLLGLPLGGLLYLVFTGAWVDAEVFWWPFGGVDLDAAAATVGERGWWNLALELAGAAMCVWIVRRARLVEPEPRRRFLRTGTLTLTAT